MIGIVIIGIILIWAAFVAGRNYERRRIKFVGKPINTQEVLGVFDDHK